MSFTMYKLNMPERHRYDGKWSDFDHTLEKAQTFKDCQKKGQMVYLLRRGNKKYPGGILGQHAHSVASPWSTPFWTLEDIEEGRPMRVVDSQGALRECEYAGLTTDRLFAKDFAYSEEYTLGLGVGLSQSDQMKLFNGQPVNGHRLGLKED